MGCEYLFRDQISLQACALLSCFLCQNSLLFCNWKALSGLWRASRTSTDVQTGMDTWSNMSGKTVHFLPDFYLFSFYVKKNWKTCPLSWDILGHPWPSTDIWRGPDMSGKTVHYLADFVFLLFEFFFWPFLPFFYSVLTETITNWRPPHIRGCAATPPYRNSI